MVPALTDGGRSFKGAALYYLHDKREVGEAERLTAERVAWTHTVNLLTDDPERAWRMMATTAMKADELKAAAGIKATGRKLTKPALAYSLAWHPSEKPTKEEQLEAAQETLKVLGLAEHQALIVAHDDEPHAHVHVIVNRVHPVEGKAATLSNSKLALSKWAQDYEERRGKVLCAKRKENNEKRAKGERVHEPRKPRNTHENKPNILQEGIAGEFIRADQKGHDAQLSQATREMHQGHAKQWEEMKRVYQTGKNRIYEESKERQKEAEREIKEAARPEWAALFAKQREEKRAFEEREQSPLGVLWNMATTAREMRRSGVASSFLEVAWGIIKHADRSTAFELAQESERRAFSRAVYARVTEARQDIREQAREQAAQFRKDYFAQCGALREAQAGRRAGMKLAWTNRNTERKAAFAPLWDRAARWKQLEATNQKGKANQPQHQHQKAQGMGLYRAKEMKPG